MTFGATVGQRHAAGRALFAPYRACAIEVPGEVVDELRATVAAHRTHVVVTSPITTKFGRSYRALPHASCW